MGNIAIIGAGQLGSRHLQAMAKVEDDIIIYIVDPSEDSLKLSRTRFAEMNQNNITLYCLKEVTELPSKIEFAVIATNSMQRLMVLKQLLEHSKVNYLILEKFLFPYIEEYEIATQLIESTNTAVFVNCARTMWPNYHKIRTILSEEKEVKIEVSGSHWNMASNSIHFLNLFSFITECNNFKVDTSALDKRLLKNKRVNYIEFTGILKITTNCKHELILKSYVEKRLPFKISIVSENYCIMINELQEEWMINGKKGYFPLIYQSNLTNIIYKQLQQSRDCNLVSYQRSVKEHLILLNAFNYFLNGREGVIT